MPSPEFPAPPDLANLLKFFESKEGKARVSRQHATVSSQRGEVPSRTLPYAGRPGNSSRQRSSQPRTWSAPSVASKMTAAEIYRRRAQSADADRNRQNCNGERKMTSPQGWDSSTQLPHAPAKPLKHQLLCRTYQPPEPVYVPASEASSILDRLVKGTVSSRSKEHPPGDCYGRGADGSAANFTESAHAVSQNAPQPSYPADTRGRDAIQTLLFYRKEVEKRRRLDPNDSLSEE